MNPLTQIRNTQKATKKEIELGLFEKASWHARFAHSAYIFTGGLDFELTEGDLLAVFAQYGEVVDVHLVRDKTTGKSKGFAFLAYEDQRSTVLAVDNLSGSTVAGRKIRVEHVDNYKKRKAELEGEDPDAVPDEPPLKRQQSDGGRNAAAVVGAADSDDSPPQGVLANRTAAESGRLADAWQAPNSLFSLLAEAKPSAFAANKQGVSDLKGKKQKHKHKKEKKQKHSHKDKRDRSRIRSRSVSRSRSRSGSPMRKQQQQKEPKQSVGLVKPATGFGPPRPSPTQVTEPPQQQQQQQRGNRAIRYDGDELHQRQIGSSARRESRPPGSHRDRDEGWGQQRDSRHNRHDHDVRDSRRRSGSRERDYRDDRGRGQYSR